MEKMNLGFHNNLRSIGEEEYISYPCTERIVFSSRTLLLMNFVVYVLLIKK
jgi:hypothetical protein